MSKNEAVIPIPIVTHRLSSQFKSIYIIPLSDMQIGNPGFNEKAFIGYRDWILEHENAFAIFPGDNRETPTMGNKASDYWDMALTPAQADKKCTELIRPLADAGRCLGFVDGNHEYRAYVATGESPNKKMVEALGLPIKLWNQDSIVIRVAFGTDINKKGSRFVYNIYMTHGWGGARRTGAQVNKTEELAAVVTNADVYVIGHEHTLYDSRWDSAFVPNSLSAKTCKKIRQVFVGAGTFCEYTKFQNRIQRRLPNIGAPRIRLEGVCGHKSHRDIHVSI